MFSQRICLLISCLAVVIAIASGSPGSPMREITDEELQTMKTFEKSPYFLPPFDGTLGTLTPAQLAKLRPFMGKIIKFMRDDLEKNIHGKPQGNWFGGLAKGLSNTGFLVKLVAEGRNIWLAPEFPFSQDFVAGLNKLMTRIHQTSDKMIGEKKYGKKTVDTHALLKRAVYLLDYVQSIIDDSPVGIYLQWEWLESMKNPANPEDPTDRVNMVAEIEDVISQLKSIGYKPDLFDTIYDKMVGGEASAMVAPAGDQQAMPQPISVGS